MTVPAPNDPQPAQPDGPIVPADPTPDPGPAVPQEPSTPVIPNDPPEPQPDQV